MPARVLLPGPGGLLSGQNLDEICRALDADEPVALPTETVYGLAANALSPAACAKIFAAKERPFTDPLICHLPTISALEEFTESNELARRLAEAFWPGPLTLVLPKRPAIPDLITSGQDTVAVRCSAHPVFQQVVKTFGRPLAAPSANRFGRISPTSADAVFEELGGRIGLIVDGGPCRHGLESTIVAVEENALRMLRSGPICEKQLGAYAPVLEARKDDVAPGRLPWHYAPATPLRMYSKSDAVGEPDLRCGLLAWTHPAIPGNWEHVEFLSASGDMSEAAHRLYACLRRLDSCGLDVIYAEPLPGEGLGRTIMDRLRKASARV
jgi:L-threonylcarbamoyladenylate synthase